MLFADILNGRSNAMSIIYKYSYQLAQNVIIGAQTNSILRNFLDEYGEKEEISSFEQDKQPISLENYDDLAGQESSERNEKVESKLDELHNQLLLSLYQPVQRSEKQSQKIAPSKYTIQMHEQKQKEKQIAENQKLKEEKLRQLREKRLEEFKKRKASEKYSKVSEDKEEEPDPSVQSKQELKELNERIRQQNMKKIQQQRSKQEKIPQILQKEKRPISQKYKANENIKPSPDFAEDLKDWPQRVQSILDSIQNISDSIEEENVKIPDYDSTLKSIQSINDDTSSSRFEYDMPLAMLFQRLDDLQERIDQLNSHIQELDI